MLKAWIRPIIYRTPVSRADGADVVLPPTDLSVKAGVPSLTNSVEGTFETGCETGFLDEIAPATTDYVFLKRRPGAFHRTGVAEPLRMLRRETIVLAGGATNDNVETSARETFSVTFARAPE